MVPDEDDSVGLNASAWLHEVRGCMQRALKLSDDEAAAIGADTTPLLMPQWTSLAHVQLILELERTFDVVFEAGEIAALASVDAITRALERLRA